jgi:hypothetical protein
MLGIGAVDALVPEDPSRTDVGTGGDVVSGDGIEGIALERRQKWGEDAARVRNGCRCWFEGGGGWIPLRVR